eukprot:TRINITY_DN6194_c0_g1_i1.p1 TRINITY_DN6194_c0_g1~~TRINITY_DN6194_c0_g1_i1.p1  ORF type:complete len:792 (-),score=272.32 TRINITY_DN6194_c0_g1_i1:139-2514(-)
MARVLSLLLLIAVFGAGVSRGAEQSDETRPFAAVPATYSFPNFNKDEIMLRSTVDLNEGVAFRLTTLPKPVPGSPNAGTAAGTIKAPGGWEEYTFFPRGVEAVSNPRFMENREDKWGPAQMDNKDVYPAAGDKPGTWLLQEGNDNWARFKVPSLWKATMVKVYETLHPGGIKKIELSSDHNEHATVYVAGQTTPKYEVMPSGARAMTVEFAPTKFNVTKVTIHVDASTQWRAYDALSVTGEVWEEYEFPKSLKTDTFEYIPNPKKPYGCDYMMFQANNGKGWSEPKKVTICYGCPSAFGRACGGHGTCHLAKCTCMEHFSGEACEKSHCPTWDGQLCNGKGKCTDEGTCKCFAKFGGRACQSPVRSTTCSAYNDPHFRSFDNAVFSFYETGEYLMHQWVGRGGLKEIITANFRFCGSRAYRLHWSPIGCDNGGCLRYGTDVVCLNGARDIRINCKKASYNNNGWQKVGPDGLMVQFIRGGHYDTMVVKTPSPTLYHTSLGVMRITTEIPKIEKNSNEILGMCGNFDGDKKNDLWGCTNWLDVPRYPTDKQKALPGGSEMNKERRRRAIAWGNFFKVDAKCSLQTCKDCKEIIPYKNFPLKYKGDMNPKLLGESEQLSEKVRQKIQRNKKDPNHALAHEELTTLALTTPRITAHNTDGSVKDFILSKAQEDLIDQQDLGQTMTETGVTVEGVPKATKWDTLPDHIQSCSKKILYYAMKKDKCLQFIGKDQFADCIWDSCAIDEEGSDSNGQAAVDKAVRENKQAEEGDEEAGVEQEELRDEAEEEEEQEEKK